MQEYRICTELQVSILKALMRWDDLQGLSSILSPLEPNFDKYDHDKYGLDLTQNSVKSSVSTPHLVIKNILIEEVDLFQIWQSQSE